MNILVCVDGSTESVKAVVKAVEIADGCRIDDVAVLHVYQPKDMVITGYSPKDHFEHETARLKEENEAIVAEAEKILRHAALRFQEKGIEPKQILKEGHPAHTISQLAEEDGYDLIVMGSRGSGGLKKMLLGSVSNAVIQETHASVLVVK